MSSYIKKLKQAQKKPEVNNNKKEEDDLNESYEARYIKEMNNDIEEAFEKKGEEIGMNEMCNNVIDNIINGKEVNELFQIPSRRKTVKMTSKLLPKLSTVIKENEEKKGNALYSERFIKPAKKIIKNY